MPVMLAGCTVLLPVGVTVRIIHANNDLLWSHVSNYATPRCVLPLVYPVVESVVKVCVGVKVNDNDY